jgi:hypothetical protein
MVSLVGVIDKNILNKHIMISNTTVANPRKEVTVNYSKQQVLDAIDNLTSNEYFKSFESFDEVLNTFTYRFEKPISGLFKLFMRAEIEVNEISETKTKITIEVSDWDNVLDDEFDVSSANILMKSILKTISTTLNPDQEVSSNETNNDNSSIFSAVLKIVGGVIAAVILLSMLAA